MFLESAGSNSQLLGEGGSCIKGDTSSALLPVKDAALVDRPSPAHIAVLMMAPKGMGSACYDVFVLLLLLSSGALFQVPYHNLKIKCHYLHQVHVFSWLPHKKVGDWRKVPSYIK